jgi:hypothetical protein
VLLHVSLRQVFATLAQNHPDKGMRTILSGIDHISVVLDTNNPAIDAI